MATVLTPANTDKAIRDLRQELETIDKLLKQLEESNADFLLQSSYLKA